jgi:uncharacterized protein YraI
MRHARWSIFVRRIPAILTPALLLALAALAVPHPAAAQSTQQVKLPFAAGTSWKPVQGYNGGTHVRGPEQYALDLVRDGGGSTAGVDVLAPVSGTLWFMNAPGSGNGCLSIKMDNGGGLIVQMCHIIARSFRTDERIQQGQVVGTVGVAGAVGNNGLAHLHLSMHHTPDLGVTRIPAPFALPDGLPLEGISLPADGSANQYGCPGSSCRPAFVSSNGAGGAVIPVPAVPVAPNPLTPAPAGGTPALLSAASASQSTVALKVGVIAAVAGAGDCMNVREGPGMSAKILTCLTDGMSVTIAGGPVTADGHTWWKLDGLGWAVGDYLVGVQAAVPTLRVGAAVIVDAGSNDCLNLRAGPGMSANVVTCLASGARVTISDGPIVADGHTWWQLDGRGWAVADYLRPRDDGSGG